jgi:hypothetical protein
LSEGPVSNSPEVRREFAVWIVRFCRASSCVGSARSWSLPDRPVAHESATLRERSVFRSEGLEYLREGSVFAGPVDTVGLISSQRPRGSMPRSPLFLRERSVFDTAREANHHISLRPLPLILSRGHPTATRNSPGWRVSALTPVCRSGEGPQIRPRSTRNPGALSPG